MCLTCGKVLCGRYENGHALSHSTSHTQHNVCLNTLNCSVYCYTCDDFVINDTGKNILDNLRQELSSDDSSSEGSTFQDESSSAKSSSHQETASTASTASTSSSDSGWADDPSMGRRLRPRKRTISSDSSEAAKRKAMSKVRSESWTISLMLLY